MAPSFVKITAFQREHSKEKADVFRSAFRKVMHDSRLQIEDCNWLIQILNYTYNNIKKD
jgi:hypothetical protein